jgi:hypothetical protein
LVVIRLLRFLRSRLTFDTARFARVAPAYLIGGFAALWLIQRVFAV